MTVLKKDDKNIKVIEINKPNKEEAEKKINELCEFLGKNWYWKLKTNKNP